jgi:hypothetical protein
MRGSQRESDVEPFRHIGGCSGRDMRVQVSGKQGHLEKHQTREPYGNRAADQGRMSGHQSSTGKQEGTEKNRQRREPGQSPSRRMPCRTKWFGLSSTQRSPDVAVIVGQARKFGGMPIGVAV